MPIERHQTKADFIRDEFSKKWSAKISRRIHLKCTDEETEYLTRPNDAIQIQEALARAHDNPVSTFVDAFACVGGDSIAAMYVHTDAHVHSVQRTRGPAEQARFDRLGENLRSFRNAYRRSGRIYWHGTDIGRFLSQCQTDISILYLDPPWATGSDPKQISTDREIRTFLQNNVFRFLKVRPSVICLKLPGKVNDIDEWPGQGYSLIEHRSLRPKGGLEIYILKDIL